MVLAPFASLRLCSMHVSGCVFLAMLTTIAVFGSKRLSILSFGKVSSHFGNESRSPAVACSASGSPSGAEGLGSCTRKGLHTSRLTKRNDVNNQAFKETDPFLDEVKKWTDTFTATKPEVGAQSPETPGKACSKWMK